MKVLLDTHVFLWFVLGQRECTPATRAIIENPKHECLVSIASLWEIGIKHALGKLELHSPIEDFFKSFTNGGFVPRPVTMPHILELSKLPLHHRDPFDPAHDQVWSAILNFIEQTSVIGLPTAERAT